MGGVARTLFFSCFLVGKMRPGWSPRLGNKNTRKNIGFWQQPDAEPCVFIVIVAWRKPEPYVFAYVFVANTRIPSRPHLGNKKS